MSRTRLANPKRGRTKAEDNAYMKAYMRDYRRKHDDPQASGKWKHEKPRGAHAANASFDPLRDGRPQQPQDLTGVLMGDPPVGRRAIDMQLSDTNRPEGS